MSGSKQIFKSNQADNQAADKALKNVSANFVERLNLFDTTLHLHTMDGLTALELGKLQNIYVTELERKQYLMTIVIPSKGPYKGMTLLRRALKETGQSEILHILEKAYENAVHAIITEKSDETVASYPVQAAAGGCYDGHTTAVCSASGLDSENDDVRNPNRPNNSNSNNDNDSVSLHSPVEQSPQPQSDDVSLHTPVQPQSNNFYSLLECQPQPESDKVVLLHSPVLSLSDNDNVASLVKQQPAVVEQQLQSQSSDDIVNSSQKSPVTVQQKAQSQTDNVSSHKSPVTMEQQLQPQLDNASLLKSPVVTVEREPQPQSNDFSSHKSLKQQSRQQPTDATSLASPVTVKQEPQPPQSDNGTSLNSPTQEQSQSQFTPYFKFRLPPTYSGTVTFAVTPSSPSRADEIPHSSNPNKSEPLEQDVQLLNAKPEDFNNDYPDHNGVASNEELQHDNDILKSIDQFECDYSVMKFVFVGDMNTGKTSLIERYVSNKFPNSPKATIIDFKCVDLTCYNTKYQLHLWDTAGQERFRAFTSVYYRDAVGVFVIYDVTRRASLESCLQWKKGVDDAVNGDPIPVVLIANKVLYEFTACEETFKVHELYSHAPVVQTPNRDCASNIKLQFNDKRRSRRKCCN